MALIKLGTIPTSLEAIHYPKLWDVQETAGPQRLCIAPEGDHVRLMMDPARTTGEPFWIMYVLLVPHTGIRAGRYQGSRPVRRTEMEQFFAEFRAYFEQDGRHHIWVTSIPDDATLVYDAHNVVYAYGPLDRYEPVLTRAGFRRSEVEIPFPHTHCYHRSFDDAERRLMQNRDWDWSPLEQPDEE